MKLTVLVENTTLTDRNFISEPGLSLYLEADGKRVLFDTGLSGVFIRNADTMQISLTDLDVVVLSHCHYDHTWGLADFIRDMSLKRMAGIAVATPDLVAHPLVFASRFRDRYPEAGSLISEERASRHFRLRLSRDPVWLTENLVFLGEISRDHAFERADPEDRRIRMADGRCEPDSLPDDSALAWRGPEGLVIITGCSHAGICNIIDQAVRVTGENRILDIVGGLHLLRPSPERLRETVAFLCRNPPRALHACHCTSLAAKIALAQKLPLQETGAGLVLEY